MGEANLFLILERGCLEYAYVRETGFHATEKSRTHVDPRLKSPSDSVDTGLPIWTDRKESLSVYSLQPASSPLLQS